MSTTMRNVYAVYFTPDDDANKALAWKGEYADQPAARLAIGDWLLGFDGRVVSGRVSLECGFVEQQAWEVSRPRKNACWSISPVVVGKANQPTGWQREECLNGRR